MVEYAQARVRVINLTLFTVFNLIGGVGIMALIEMESTMQINLVCLNIQNKPTSSECNSCIGFFSLRANNLGRNFEVHIWLLGEKHY